MSDQEFIQRFFGQGDDQPTEEDVPEQATELEFYRSLFGGKAEQEARRTRAALGLSQPEEEQ